MTRKAGKLKFVSTPTPTWLVEVTYGSERMTERVPAPSAAAAIETLAGWLALPVTAFDTASASIVA